MGLWSFLSALKPSIYVNMNYQDFIKDKVIKENPNAEEKDLEKITKA